MNIPTGHAYVEFTDSESATKAEKYMNGGIASLLSLLASLSYKLTQNSLKFIVTIPVRNP